MARKGWWRLEAIGCSKGRQLRLVGSVALEYLTTLVMPVHVAMCVCYSHPAFHALPWPLPPM